MIKNKKGFTLVELLGAIVILGIISTIAIVSLTKVLESSHKKYYDTQVKLFQAAGQTYFSDHKDLLPTINFGVNRVNLGVLIDQGYINEIVDYNKKECYTDERSYVTVTRRGPSSYVYQAVLSCKDRSTQTQDNNNEKGNFNISLDYSNGIDSSNGFKEGNIYYVRGTLSLGLTITTNSSGDNAGITGYRYSIVKKSNGKIYKTSEVIPSKDSICTSSGDNCTTLSDTINIRAKDIKDGEYTLEIEAFNLKGNSNNKQFATYTIVIDKTKPKCNIDITDGDKGNFIDNNQWYKDGKKKKVTLKMTIKEKNKAKSRLETTEFTDSFLSVSYKNTNDEMTKYQTTNTSSEGQVWYGQVEDKAGNSVKCTKKVFFDMTAPTCEITKRTSNGSIIGKNSWTKSDYTATRSCKDDNSKCDSKSLDNWSKNVYAAANTVNNNDITSDNDSVFDKAGNKGSCGTITAMIDKENPSCSVKIEGTKGNFQPAGNFYGNTAVQFYKKGDSPIAKLTKGDGYGSGLVTYGISKNNSELDNKKDSLPLNDGDNDWYINGYARDKVGNVSYCNTQNSGDKIPYYFIDLTPPLCPSITADETPNDKNWINATILFTFRNFSSDTRYFDWYTSKDNVFSKKSSFNSITEIKRLEADGKNRQGMLDVYDYAGNNNDECLTSYYNIDQTEPSIEKENNGHNGFAFNGHNRMPRTVICTDNLSGFSKKNNFTTDLYRDEDFESDEGTSGIYYKRTLSLNKIEMKYVYKATGYKYTMFYCKDKAGNDVYKHIDEIPSGFSADNHQAICCGCRTSSERKKTVGSGTNKKTVTISSGTEVIDASQTHSTGSNYDCGNQQTINKSGESFVYNSGKTDSSGTELYLSCRKCGS